MSGQRVVVVGGSLAGLSAALFLARRGHQVVVLERDPTPTPDTVEEAGEWRRRNTPQAAHSHAFLARCRAILAQEAPDVLDAMIDAGVRQAVLVEARPPTVELDEPTADDRELIVLNARRSVFEWVLRRAAEREPGVDLRLGTTVTGLDAQRNGSIRPHVRAVVTNDGAVEADVVVDAGGKRSPVRGWIPSDDDDGGAEQEVACGISYLTRFYQLRGDEPTRLNRGFTHGASFDRYSCLVFPADNGAFSITFGVLPEDKDMRGLRHPAAFDASAAAIPAIAPWVDPEAATPTGDVATMSSLRNLLRSSPAGAPLGLHAIGDAACVTNPAHTRGSTLALRGAQRLAQVVTDHAGDPGAQGDAMADFTTSELTAWFDDSIEQDAARLARWRPHEPPSQPRTRLAVSNGEAYVASQRHGDAWREFTRLQNALLLPQEVLGGDSLAAAVAYVGRSGWRPPANEAPDHDELVAIAATAAGP